mgnify:CR=1 FL=1
MRKCRSTVALLAAVMFGSILAVAAPTAVAADVFTISSTRTLLLVLIHPLQTGLQTSQRAWTVKEAGMQCLFAV